ncbi:MAG: hypothetical protein ABIA93_05830 [Candidatus Woesearchaeota archaeon]
MTVTFMPGKGNEEPLGYEFRGEHFLSPLEIHAALGWDHEYTAYRPKNFCHPYEEGWFRTIPGQVTLYKAVYVPTDGGAPVSYLVFHENDVDRKRMKSSEELQQRIENLGTSSIDLIAATIRANSCRLQSSAPRGSPSESEAPKPL